MEFDIETDKIIEIKEFGLKGNEEAMVLAFESSFSANWVHIALTSIYMLNIEQRLT